MKLNSLYLIVFVSFLSGCATSSNAPATDDQQLLFNQDIKDINEWSVKGRIGIRTEEGANSLNFSWQHTPTKQLLLLYDSFGTTYVKLQVNEGMAILELEDNRIFHSNNVELLLKETLGHPLPIEHLAYWVKGIPYPGEKNDSTFNKEGRLEYIEYKQWAISFSKYRVQPSFHHFMLPTKIKLKDDATILSLSLRKWSPVVDL